VRASNLQPRESPKKERGKGEQQRERRGVSAYPRTGSLLQSERSELVAVEIIPAENPRPPEPVAPRLHIVAKARRGATSPQ